jgi:PIN domain nuclease of toxin-antitoxin system
VAFGRLTLPEPFHRGVEHSGFRRLLITFDHAETAAALPRHHADPFDRMLVAQAQLEQCTLVTHDQALAPYGISMLWT